MEEISTFISTIHRHANSYIHKSSEIGSTGLTHSLETVDPVALELSVSRDSWLRINQTFAFCISTNICTRIDVTWNQSDALLCNQSSIAAIYIWMLLICSGGRLLAWHKITYAECFRVAFSIVTLTQTKKKKQRNMEC